jgi:DNA-binding LytR/AlgR family response regulator
MKEEDPITSILIVDDEEEARNILERQLLRFSHIRVVGKAAGADEALEMIIGHSPDIVFLDIQMPGRDGFSLVQDMKKYLVRTTVIFVTAHAEYAINALKVAAFDYLLKPVIFEELKETLYRYKTEKRLENTEKKIDQLIDLINKEGKLKFNTRTGYILIAPDDIIYCEADVNYTTLFLGSNRKEVVTINLGRLEEMLSDYSFHRISRSILINTQFLAKVDRKSRTCILMRDNAVYKLYIPPNHIREMEDLVGQ